MQQGQVPLRAGVWTCPFCQYQGPPRVENKVTTAGWVAFWVLLLGTCGLLCWIGLLMREELRKCPACGTRVG